MPETKQNPTYKLELTSSPHIHSRWSTLQAMWLVVIALIPTVIAAVLFFGFYQLLIILVSVGFALGTEAAIKVMRKREVTIKDGSGLITGLLLGLIIPPNFSLSSTALGAIVAVAIGKEVFGGLGYNIFNPALVGRAFLQAAFPVPMTTWTQPNFAIDGVSSATPLSAFKFDSIIADNQSLMLGNIGGSIGETSSIAVLNWWNIFNCHWSCKLESSTFNNCGCNTIRRNFLASGFGKLSNTNFSFVRRRIFIWSFFYGN